MNQQQPDIIPNGLPDHLPEGERLIWQGRPDWKRLAINAFHIRKVAFYFAVIIVGQAIGRLGQQENFALALRLTPTLVLMAFAACGILLLLAYLNAKTTLYTLTSKRLLLKVGIALPAYINIPLKNIESASFAETGNGCGTIVFRTSGNTRLAYLLLWPHVRPWHFTQPQPALRDVPNAEGIATLVAEALGRQSLVNTTTTAQVHPRTLMAAE